MWKQNAFHETCLLYLKNEAERVQNVQLSLSNTRGTGNDFHSYLEAAGFNATHREDKQISQTDRFYWFYVPAGLCHMIIGRNKENWLTEQKSMLKYAEKEAPLGI